MSPATTGPVARALYLRMSEDELLENIRDLAEKTGFLLFHDHDSRRSMGPGFPDCVAVGTRQRRMLVFELKSATGWATPLQVKWLTGFAATGAEVALWRPGDWHSGLIQAVFGGKPMPPLDPASLIRNGRNRT